MSDEKEYIERGALIRFVKQNTPNIHGDTTMRCVERALKAAPATADVVEVRHGYWIPSPDGINPIRCSECNMPAPFAAGENEFGDFEICRYPSSYCHECGAKMDGGKEQK